MENHPVQAPDLKAIQLLLVEDQSIIALTESLMLKKNGYDVLIASSGEEALGFFNKGSSPDLVLMDIDLGPGIDGTETARRILAEWDVPIVFLTSHSSREMVEKVRGITRYGYVIKHSGDFVLLSTIEMAIDLFKKDQTIRVQQSIQQRAEEIARIGHWFVHPGTETICFSANSRAILGISADSLSFGEYEVLVSPETRSQRASDFSQLISRGTPYDATYRVQREKDGRLVPIRSSGRKVGNTVVGVIQDLTSVEKLLYELKATERRQAVTLRSIGDGVIAADNAGRVTDLNAAAEELTGWKAAEAAGRPIEEVFRIVNAHSRAAVENPVAKVLETGHTVGLANHTVLIARDGTERHIADSASPIRDDRGSPIGIVLIFRDVSREYREVEILEKNEKLFRAIFVESHTPMLLIEPGDGRIHEANRSAERFYGRSLEDLKRMAIYEINAAPRGEVSGDMKVAVRRQASFRFTHRVAGGELRPVRVVSGPIHIDGKDLLLSLVFDAGEDADWEKKLGEERARSGTLLRDAHHRMKNNFQILNSLIELHLGDIVDTQVRAKMRELQGRILSIALVYKQLYQETDQDTLSSGNYLGALLNSLRESYFTGPIRLTISIAELQLTGRLAGALGLIVTELVVNATKHAFPEGRSGTISVSFAEESPKAFVLTIADNGIGMEGASNRERSGGGIGLALVRSLAEQEGGSVEIVSGPDGTTVKCAFLKHRLQ